MSEILTKNEVIKFCKIGRHIIDKAAKKREISYIELERRLLFREEDVQALSLSGLKKLIHRMGKEPHITHKKKELPKNDGSFRVSTI